MSGMTHCQFLLQHQVQHNMEIQFILIDDKLDAHYIITTNVNSKKKPTE
jgi:hypothetical protein